MNLIVLNFINVLPYIMKDASIMLKSETKVKWYTFLSPVIWEIFVWLPIYAALKFFLRMEIHGQENLKRVAFPYILASNHTSELDPVAIKAIFGPLPPFIPVFYVARESSFYKKRYPIFFMAARF